MKYILLVLLLTGCVTRTTMFVYTPDKGHFVKVRTTAVMVKFAGTDLKEDLQTAEFISGTKAGTMSSSVDNKMVESIVSGVLKGLQ